MALASRILYQGSRDRKIQLQLGIPGGKAADEPGVLVLDSGATTPVQFKYFPATDGTLRVTSGATFGDSDGDAVGAAASVTLDQAFNNGAFIDGAHSSGTAVLIGYTVASSYNMSLYHDGSDMYMAVNIGDLKITAQGGDVNFDNENLTSTGWLKIGSTVLTLGTTNTTPYIVNTAGALTFFDTDYNSAITLKQLAGGALNNPTVTGDLTITNGQIFWTDSAHEIAGAFSFANTTTNGLNLTTTVTTAAGVDIIANACVSGTILKLEATEGTLNAGLYLQCYDNTAAGTVFSVGEDGVTVLAGAAAGTPVLTLTAGDLALSSGIITQVTTSDNIAALFDRNHGSSTATVVQIHQDHTGSTGPCLLLTQDSTGAADTLQITGAGTGYGISVIGTAAGGSQALFQGPASQTASIVVVDGTTGSWIGAATTGMLHLSSDGALVADASLLRIYSHGAIAAANDGYCLEIIEDAAAQATSYAVRIASTSNEALHVDAGLSVFDENITIAAGGITLTADDINVSEGKIVAVTTQEDTSKISKNLTATTGAVLEVEQTHTASTGSALLVDQNATGNAIALEITHDGDLAAIDIVASVARTGKVINIPMANQLAQEAISISGAATGTSGYGIIDVITTGALAGNALRIDSNSTNAATGQLIYLVSSGKQAAGTNGICLSATDTGAATTTSYTVYIASTNNEALHVDTGLSVFDEGPIVQYIAAASTDNTPKIAELNGAFGITVGAAYNGFIGILYDNTHANDHYICVVSNAVWSWVKTTEAGS